ncbi:LIM/homeobox protein Awh, putative [Pediculus humanus corporis]|uniref:LIM/homeobox protein Awh, putative n=1 Tax=Pediculus humanus subsp. corporis TaxID=121224 RepID=E0V9S0_PEDHC|nr:LIM/homeobox protein Awh, putative [Pediculus humanus corporis]EEB10126.1 LIM/homeobox protein Awh, putative [Pediculus humanus corporis]
MRVCTEHSICVACGDAITDKYLLQVNGRSWHSHCLRCSVCQLALDRHPSFSAPNVQSAVVEFQHPIGLEKLEITCIIWLVLLAILVKDKGGDSEGYHKNKAKRVRTTFTEEQLQVLQANFQLDSNPDGQDLERIAQITGLSKRVTQVWFQNSRARQKKHLHTGKLKTPSRDDNNTFGRHINLHLTYSFQSPQNAKSPVFVPRPVSQSSSMDELSQDSTMMSCMRSEV